MITRDKEMEITKSFSKHSIQHTLGTLHKGPAGAGTQHAAPRRCRLGPEELLGMLSRRKQVMGLSGDPAIAFKIMQFYMDG